MISLKLADIFTNLAEVKKADPAGKKDVLSLMSAARTLRDDPGIIESILKGRKPDMLEGVDGYCYSLITEYLEKGAVEEYERSSCSYSEDLVKLIRMTGLGRKRMFSIYDAYGIRDMEDIKAAFKGRTAGDVLKDPPVKKDILNPLFLERIQKSVEYFEGLKGLSPRWPVEYYAGAVSDSFSRAEEIKRIAFTGSLRRKKSLVGDIDLLVLPVFNQKAIDLDRSTQLLQKIAGFPFIRKLVSLKRTAGDISALYETIYEIDIEIIVACEKTWAWQMFMTTGSKRHISELEEYTWKEKIPRLEDHSRKELKSEGSIYSSMGLQYIPPELREGKGEVGLSARKKLPRLVEAGDLKGDLHIHSVWSDGLIKYRDMVHTAKKLGYEYIAISDHSISNYYGNGLDTGRLLEKLAFMGELKKRYRDIRILSGAEIDVKKPGVFDYSPGIIKKLDIAIASLHSSFTCSARENTSRAVSALERDYFDMIAHPTGVVFGNRSPIFIEMDLVIEAAADNGKALEINSYYMRLDLDEENARKAAAAGARIAINTDSHRSGNMEMIQLGVDVARRAGLQKKDIINTMTVDELEDWRRHRKR